MLWFRLGSRELASCVALGMFALGSIGSTKSPLFGGGSSASDGGSWAPDCPPSIDGGGRHITEVNNVDEMQEAIVNYCFHSLTQGNTIYANGTPAAHTLKGIQTFAEQEKLTNVQLNAIARRALKNENSCPQFPNGLAHAFFCSKGEKSEQTRRTWALKRAAGRESSRYDAFLLEARNVHIQSPWWSAGQNTPYENLPALLLFRKLDTRAFARDLRESVRDDVFLSLLASKVPAAYATTFATLLSENSKRIADAEARGRAFRAEVAQNEEAWKFIYELELGDHTEACRDRLYGLFAARIREVAPKNYADLQVNFVDNYAAALSRANTLCKEGVTRSTAMPFSLSGHGDISAPRTEIDAWFNLQEASSKTMTFTAPTNKGRTVSTVKKSGDHAVVTFKADRWSEDITRCTPTNRLIAIHRDGTLEYDEVCSVVGQDWHTDQEAPLMVRTDIGAVLKPGSYVAIAGADTGPERTVIVAYPSAADAEKQVNLLAIVNVALR